MSDLKISNDGTGFDLVIEDGDVVLHVADTDDDRANEVLQRVVYRLMTWTGESVYDRGAGLPYLDGIFGDEPIGDVAALLTQTVIDTDGVDELVGIPSYEFDSESGTLSIAISVRVGATVTDLALSVGGA